jgi:hypothetical protein
MTNQDSSPESRPSARPSRFARWPAAASSPGRPNRLTFRLIGIPVLAVAGVLIYRGLHDRFYLPECDSGRAKSTLADVLKQLKIEPLRYEPIKTISVSKAEVVCSALLPLADGSNLNVDYSFFWQGSAAQMKYSISRRDPQSSALSPPRQV